jgi:tocopherol O-methyltransferase
VVSPYYKSLWGEHLHHGYWIKGDETKEEAQTQLITHLAEIAQIKRGGSILDIGCGFGASSIYLAQQFDVVTTGITTSPVQVEMAQKAAAKAGVGCKFLLMDAEKMTFDEKFDVLWSVESISHYQNVARFFEAAVRMLKPHGTFALIDWFKRAELTSAQNKKFIQPIEKGMFVELHTMAEYQALLSEQGLKIVSSEILNENCAKTWDICLEIVKDKTFWSLAAKLGTDFVHYLEGFKAMRAGFASGTFVYGLIVAERSA